MSLTRCITPLLTMAMALGSLLSPAAARADETKLRYTYPTEAITYRFILQSENETSGGMFGNTPVKGGLAQVALCQFRKVGDGDSARVEMIYKALKFRQDTARGKTLFLDTSDPKFRESKPETIGVMARLMTMLLEKPILLTIDSRGQITRIDNLAAFHEAAKEGGSIDPLAQATFETMISEDAIKRMLSDFFAVLPEGPVKPGATWTSSSTSDMRPVGSVKQSAAWIYAGDESDGGHNVAKLSAAVTIELVPADPKAKPADAGPPGMDKAPELKDAKGAHTVKFDPKAGIVRAASWKLDIPATMSVNLPQIGSSPPKTATLTINNRRSGEAALVPAGAPLDPDGVIKKPEGATPGTPVPSAPRPSSGP